MHATKSNVKNKSLRIELRKNIHVGVALYSGKPVVSAWINPAKFFAYPGSLSHEKELMIR